MSKSKSQLTTLLGKELLKNSNGEHVSVESLVGPDRVIGLYFSALWCPPCRSFTPLLVNFYNKLAKQTDSDKNLAKDSLEIVFVSADNDKKQFDEFFKEMPWLALPFADLERKLRLPKKFRVQTIPTLVLLEADSARTITIHGRDLVIDDSLGLEFPWRPRNLHEIFAETTFISNKGSAAYGDFEDGIKGLYFSANWCPPCKAFTPLLMDVYSKIRASGQKFEVIFVSSDRSQQSFDMCVSSMPWLAVPYENEKLRKEFAMQFAVRGIPTLVLLDNNNKVISKEGRCEIMMDPEGKNFPWRPQLVNELTQKYGMSLSEGPCLILFCDGLKQEMELSRQILLPVAEDWAQKRQDDDHTSLRFFIGAESEVCDSLRDFAELEDSVPLLVIVDIPDGKRYVMEEDVEITSDVVRTFVDNFHADELVGSSLKDSAAGVVDRPVQV